MHFLTLYAYRHAAYHWTCWNLGRVGKACETLQALFERNGHICLFCMKHYAEAGFGAGREQVEFESFSSMKTPVVWISPWKFFILFEFKIGWGKNWCVMNQRSAKRDVFEQLPNQVKQIILVGCESQELSGFHRGLYISFHRELGVDFWRDPHPKKVEAELQLSKWTVRVRYNLACFLTTIHHRVAGFILACTSMYSYHRFKRLMSGQHI